MVSATALWYRYIDTLKGCVVPGGGFPLDDILGNWWCGGGVRDMNWTEGTGKRCTISTWLFFFISLYIWKFKSCNIFNFRLQVTHRKYAKGDHLWWINILKFIRGFFFLSRDIASQAEKMRERDDILKIYRKNRQVGRGVNATHPQIFRFMPTLESNVLSCLYRKAVLTQRHKASSACRWENPALVRFRGSHPDKFSPVWWLIFPSFMSPILSLNINIHPGDCEN